MYLGSRDNEGSEDGNENDVCSCQDIVVYILYAPKLIFPLFSPLLHARRFSNACMHAPLPFPIKLAKKSVCSKDVAITHISIYSCHLNSLSSIKGPEM